MSNQEVSILEMRSGAIMEQIDNEVAKIMANIVDPNTKAERVRTLNITVSFTPSEDRTRVTVRASAKSKLQSTREIQTSLLVGITSAGEIKAAELIPNVQGQVDMFGNTQEAPKLLKIVGGDN